MSKHARSLAIKLLRPIRIECLDFRVPEQH